jgi:RNA polymerase sigma-70 factor (ECF subfamily)
VVLHLQGHSLKEVGSLLGWTEKKAENLVYRALAGLRTCLVTKGIRP